MTLSKEQVRRAIQARASQTVSVEVPEWGGSVLVRRLSYEEIEELGLADGGRPDAGQTARLLARCLVCEDGSQMFSDEEARELARADVAVFTRLFGEVLRINGLLSAELEEMMARFGEAQRDVGSSG